MYLIFRNVKEAELRSLVWTEMIDYCGSSFQSNERKYFKRAELSGGAAETSQDKLSTSPTKASQDSTSRGMSWHVIEPTCLENSWLSKKSYPILWFGICLQVTTMRTLPCCRGKRSSGGCVREASPCCFSASPTETRSSGCGNWRSWCLRKTRFVPWCAPIPIDNRYECVPEKRSELGQGSDWIG